MELDSLDKLEERISKAVAHIGKLTEVKDRLEEENKQLASQKVQLEKELKDKVAALQKLQKQSGKVSEKVKEKVEGLLNKINIYEQSLG
jgi:regulator of replication initiation timing